jgi:hypothetical protein
MEISKYMVIISTEKTEKELSKKKTEKAEHVCRDIGKPITNSKELAI